MTYDRIAAGVNDLIANIQKSVTQQDFDNLGREKPVMEVKNEIVTTTVQEYTFPRINAHARMENGKFVEFVLDGGGTMPVRIRNVETLKKMHEALGEFLLATGEIE